MPTRKASNRPALAPAKINCDATNDARNAESEVSKLKQQNEALKAEMATLTAQLSGMSVNSHSENQPPRLPYATPVPTVPEPNYSLIKMPQQPVKPTNAYTQFCNSLRPTLQGNVAEQAKVMGAKWKEMSDAEKQPFVAKASADRARFEKEMKSFQAEVARIDLQKSSLAKLYESKKTAVALEFYEKAAAATQREPKPQGASAKNSIERPLSPKKNKSAYMFFCADRREAMAKKMSNGEKLPLGEQQKLLSAEWSKLQKTKTGQKKLAKYNDLAATDKTRYAEELEEYKRQKEHEVAHQMAVARKQLEAETKLAMKTFAPQIKAEAAAAEKLEEAKQLKKERKAQRELEPKRPRGAYNFFCIGERESIVKSMAGELGQQAFMTELGKRWREASPQLKAKYEKQADADKKRFEREMEAFKGRSVAE